jgi:DNA polymerase III subunit delta'
MAFTAFADQKDNIELLQNSLARGRLGHAYLFDGHDLAQLEAVATTLAKALNCENPPARGKSGLALDSCDQCLNCRKITNCAHPDVLWVRPESKSRIITIDQMRQLMHTVQLKPTQAAWKTAVIVAADRLNIQAANAFLKTLEEPPGQSIIILLSTEPANILETILSRCLRLRFAGEGARLRDPGFAAWMGQFSELASGEQGAILNRYRLLSLLASRLAEIKAGVQETLAQRSPLEKYEDIDSKQRERWEDELDAAIEAEYRRERGDVLIGLQWWLRDVWLTALKQPTNALTFPSAAEATRKVASRIDPKKALENLGVIDGTLRLLSGNVQEALALEVGLLSLAL